MKLNASALRSFLLNPDPNVFIALVYGTDRGQVSEQTSALRKVWLEDNYDDFSITVLSGGDLRKKEIELVDEMAAYSLSGGQRLLHIKNPNLEDGKSALAALSKFEGPHNIPVARLIIEAGSLPPTNNLRKNLEKERGKAIVIACYPDNLSDVSRNCKKMLLDAGHLIDPDALELLASSIPPDRRILRLELEKLICFVADKPQETISKTHVQAVISQAGDGAIDKLVFACVEGRSADADMILSRVLQSGQAPVMIVRAIARHLHRMHQVMSSAKNEGSIVSAMSQLRPPVFAMHRAAFSRHCSIWSTSNLEQALSKSLATEKELKSALGPQPYLIGRFILAISSIRH